MLNMLPHRCIRYSRSRHTRAKAFLVAALGDLMWMVLTSLGLLSELGTLYRMSVSMRSTSGATILRCLQMQVGRGGRDALIW
jgi:hypothetical protein